MSALRNPDELWPEERTFAPIPPVSLITERVIDISQSREVRPAREHLASLSDERRAELEWENDRG